MCVTVTCMNNEYEYIYIYIFVYQINIQEQKIEATMLDFGHNMS